MTVRTTPANSIHGVARFVGKAGRESDLEEALLAVVVATRDEPGNLYVDMIRLRDQPAVFHLVSGWRDDAALEAHFRQDHVVGFLAQAAGLQAETNSVSFGVMVGEPAQTRKTPA